MRNWVEGLKRKKNHETLVPDWDIEVRTFWNQTLVASSVFGFGEDVYWGSSSSSREIYIPFLKGSEKIARFREATAELMLPEAMPCTVTAGGQSIHLSEWKKSEENHLRFHRGYFRFRLSYNSECKVELGRGVSVHFRYIPRKDDPHAKRTKSQVPSWRICLAWAMAVHALSIGLILSVGLIFHSIENRSSQHSKGPRSLAFRSTSSVAGHLGKTKKSQGEAPNSKESVSDSKVPLSHEAALTPLGFSIEQRGSLSRTNGSTFVREIASLFSLAGLWNWVILGCSFLGVSLVIQRWSLLKTADSVSKPEVLRVLQNSILLGTEDQAIGAMAKVATPMTQLVKAGLTAAQNGSDPEIIRSALDASLAREIPLLERSSGTIPLLANLVCLIGVLGSAYSLTKTLLPAIHLPSFNTALLSLSIIESMFPLGFGLFIAILFLGSHIYLNHTAKVIQDDLYEVSATTLNLLGSQRQYCQRSSNTETDPTPQT